MELLVAVVVIAVLAGLLIGCVRMVRESAKRTACVNNLRQMGMGALAFRQDNAAYPNGDPIGSWPACVAAATVFTLADTYGLDQRAWTCPDGPRALAFTDFGNSQISEADARTAPTTSRAVVSYQYLANFGASYPWVIRRAHQEANLALAGDLLSSVDGQQTGNHIATSSWNWNASAFKERWGGNELFLDGSVRWFAGTQASGYFTNWATFLMVLSQ